MLKSAGIDAPEVEAEFLLTYLLNIKRHELYLNPDKELTKEQSRLFKRQIESRSARKPCQYITGRTEFMGLTIKVTPDTLIPRPETELIVEELLRLLKKKNGSPAPPAPLILDLCTGSGCIAVAAAMLVPGAHIVATDISTGALEVAKSNALLNSVDSRVDFLQGSLFTALNKSAGGETVPPRFDFILSNPPYINSTDLKELQREVIEHEPREALDGGTDGLDFIKEIISNAPAHLKAGGALLMEIGFDQAHEVTTLLGGSKFKSFSIKKDLNNIGRTVVAFM